MNDLGHADGDIRQWDDAMRGGDDGSIRRAVRARAMVVAFSVVASTAVAAALATVLGSSGEVTRPMNACADNQVHVPVMIERVSDLLAPALARPGAVVVDATLGLGGHA